MSALVAVVLSIPALLLAVVLDLVRGELRERIARTPYTILRLARLLVPADLREGLHDEEWLPELQHILDASEGLPISRLLRGTWYALGRVHGTRAIARARWRPPSNRAGDRLAAVGRSPP